MMQTLTAIAVAISLATTLMLSPAYADVVSLSLSEDFFVKDGQFTLTGTVDGSGPVDIIIKNANGEERGKVTSAVSAKRGETFTTQPVLVSSYFPNIGVYNATAQQAGTQDNPIVIQIRYDGTRIFEVKDFVLKLNSIRDITVTAEDKMTFVATVTDNTLTGLKYRLGNNAPLGSTLDADTGRFIWTPSASQGSNKGTTYEFYLVVTKGVEEDRQQIRIIVTEPEPTEPVLNLLASFVKPGVDPQSYVDRYNNEPKYKEWFDASYPQYSSIYDAVGLEEPKGLASFVKPGVDPQSYVDRYNNEPKYKEWFDASYPQYSSIYDAVGLEEPKGLASFVKPGVDPQSYVDRYNNEPEYRKWFDTFFTQYSSIYEAVGLSAPNATTTVEPVADAPTTKPVTTTTEPVADADAPTTKPSDQSNLIIPAPFVDPEKDPQSYVDRYNNEPSYKEWFDTTHPEYSSIHEAVGLEAPKVLAPFVDPEKDPQSYVDRYNNEPSYKEWFDKTHPEMTIYDAVGLEAPKVLAPFVDPEKDPQSYVDRYNNEPSYKEWFDKTHPEMTIYDAVGLEEPKPLAPFVDPEKDPQSYVDRYNNEPSYKEWFDRTHPEYASIYEAVGLEDPAMMMMDGNATASKDSSNDICGQGTTMVDGVCVPGEDDKAQVVEVPVGGDDGGGCLIATAAYGSEMAPQVQTLREIRDGQLLETESGTSFMMLFNDIYYSFSPYVADYQRENPVFRDLVKVTITPMIMTLSIMEHADTEAEVLLYGVSVILLNIGMYVVAPVTLLLMLLSSKKITKAKASLAGCHL